MWCSQKSEDSSSRSIIALRTTRSETRSNKEYNFTRLPVSRIKLKMSHIAIQRDILLAISNQALGSSSAPKTTVLFRICRCSSKLPKDKKKRIYIRTSPKQNCISLSAVLIARWDSAWLPICIRRAVFLRSS